VSFLLSTYTRPEVLRSPGRMSSCRPLTLPGSGQWAARGTLVHVEHRLVDPRQYRTPVLTESVLRVDPTNTDQTIRDCSIFGVFGLTRRAEVRRDGHGV
jgi:hypothetical protein